jgi:putative peptidoglycan lipid II flippase
MKDSFRRALRTMFFVAVPSAVGLVMLRTQIVSLLFQYGKFTSVMTDRTGAVIAFYAIGLWAYCGVHVATRLLYSVQDTKTPVRIAAGMVALNLALNLALVGRMGEAGLAFATAITSTVTFVLLLISATRKIGVIGLSEVIVSFCKTFVCSVLMALAVAGAAVSVQAHLATESVGARLAVVAAGLAAGVAIFTGAAALLRCQELGEIMSVFTRTENGHD